MNEQIDEQMNGEIDGQMNGQMKGKMNGQMGGQMNGLMTQSKKKQTLLLIGSHLFSAPFLLTSSCLHSSATLSALCSHRFLSRSLPNNLTSSLPNGILRHAYKQMNQAPFTDVGPVVHLQDIRNACSSSEQLAILEIPTDHEHTTDSNL